MPNTAHQFRNAVFEFGSYAFAVVEFDDQGRCYERGQMDALVEKLDELLHQHQDAVILVFVHGWKHDGRSDDTNLQKFREMVERAAAEERPDGAPVLGIFVAWRGLSLYGFDILENVTFWDRKQAGFRVAMGAPRELFGRLRQFKHARLRAGGSPLLVIIGHSFGGLIVYSALAQSLIEAAATQTGKLVPSFADLVLLVNPALEGVRYLPIHDLVKTRTEASFALHQRPVFVCVTAYNDWATRFAFPVGMAVTRLQESTKGREEKQALIRTMGHLTWMQTHEITLQPSSTGHPCLGPVELQRVRFAERNPFWVVGATRDVVDGHNGIWLPSFVGFVEALVLGHMQEARAIRLKAGETAIRPS
jgi:hypothetical protein